MGAYLFVIALLIFFILKYDVGHKQRGKQQSQLIVLILLVLMSGLRYHIGGDSILYEKTFYLGIPLLSRFSSFDMGTQPLWVLLNSICKTFFGSFVSFQIVHAIILNTLIFRFIRKTTDYVFTALFFTFCITWWNLSFEILRESLSVGIYLNAVLFLKEKKYVIYAILGALMIGFHWFAFIMVIITPIIMFANQRIVIPVLILVSIYLYFFIGNQFFNILDIIASDTLSEDASTRFNIYLGQEGGHGRVSLNFNGLMRLFLLSILFPLITLIYNNKETEKINFSKLIVLFIVFGVLQTKLVIFSRFYNYIYVVLIVSFVNILYKRRIKQPLLREFYMFLVLIFLATGCISFYMPNEMQKALNESYNTWHIPYRTIFEAD